MQQLLQISVTSFKMAFIELKANKLRTFLSLLGITIGIFCIVAVSAVLDSLEASIRTNVASLGSDVIYLNKWPWTDEGGEYKWWQYMNRPVLKVKDLKALENKAQTLRYATLLYDKNDVTAKQNKYSVEGITCYATTPNFEKMQNFEIEKGRYFQPQELNAGNNMVVLGYDVERELFPSGNPLGKTVSFMGRNFTVIGTMKKSGDNIAGFNFDRGLIISYFAAAAIDDVNSPNAGITLMAKAKQGFNSDDLSTESEGILRAEHKIEPGTKNDFSINKLSQITEQLNQVFGMINAVGKIIAIFSLLVGGFGIANIMFVTVKERTKIIGLKKAIGAKRIAILIEFLMEAIALCLFGGLIGIVLVFMLALIFTYGMDFKVSLSLENIIYGISISTIIGIIAGFVPAYSASKLDPVVAIRSN
jgi:putative ABC transport system permease protein